MVAAHSTSRNNAATMKLSKVPSPGPPPYRWGYCVSPDSVPTQLNLQLGGPDSVVVSFFTFEKTNATAPPVVEWAAAGAARQTTIVGATRIHNTATNTRHYHMHFVRLPALVPRGRYGFGSRRLTTRSKLRPPRRSSWPPRKSRPLRYWPLRRSRPPRYWLRQVSRPAQY